MRKPLFLLLLAVVFLCNHDLYLKMDTYFLQPDQQATLNLYNGTFENSENLITRDRMLDASVVAHGKRTPIDPAQWSDQDSTITQLNFTTGKAGTYVAGVSTKARNIELTATKFNNYLEHDGILDMLQQRKDDDLLDQPAVENYAKHVKAIYQVGDKRTSDWNTVLGYPIEFVPQENPYAKYSGDELTFQLLLDGKPLANQLVYADYKTTAHSHSHTSTALNASDNANEHYHGDESHSHSHYEATTDENENSHSHTGGQQLRTDANGMVTAKLPKDGLYYIRTIYMETTTDEGLTHKSYWSTLTWEVTHKHDASTHTHNHDHEHEDEIPSWVFWLGSIAIIVVLFFIFRKKTA